MDPETKVIYNEDGSVTVSSRVQITSTIIIPKCQVKNNPNIIGLTRQRCIDSVSQLYKMKDNNDN